MADNEKQLVTVAIGGEATEKEIKELLAKIVGVANREMGYAGYCEGMTVASVLPGMEIILATRNGNNFDPIMRQKLQYTWPAGKFVAAFLVLPIK